eukprot:6193742-Pleurochrysis_carterae.AAC.3
MTVWQTVSAFLQPITCHRINARNGDVGKLAGVQINESVPFIFVPGMETFEQLLDNRHDV